MSRRGGGPTSPTTWSSLLTAPSVIRITRFRTSGSPCSERSSARSSAGRISVPLPAASWTPSASRASIGGGARRDEPLRVGRVVAVELDQRERVSRAQTVEGHVERRLRPGRAMGRSSSRRRRRRRRSASETLRRPPCRAAAGRAWRARSGRPRVPRPARRRSESSRRPAASEGRSRDPPGPVPSPT